MFYELTDLLLLVDPPIPHSQKHYSNVRVYCCCDDDPEVLEMSTQCYLRSGLPTWLIEVRVLLHCTI